MDQGLAFYLNGEMDNGTSRDIGILPGDNVFLGGMVIINTTDQSARNVSTAQVDDGQARARASMQYVPGIGQKGALVLLGGSSFPPNQLSSSDIVNLV